MKRITTILVFLMLGSFLVAGSAFSFTIDFETADNHASTGLITQSGDDFFGTDILLQAFRADTTGDGIDNVSAVLDTPLVLSFDTDAGVLSVNGSFSIDDSVIATGTILDGTITSFTGTTYGDLNLSFIAYGNDYKNEDLLEYLGIPTSTTWEFAAITLTGSMTELGWVANSVDVSNAGSPVPEPAAMLLFGSGLIAIAASCRKKLMK